MGTSPVSEQRGGVWLIPMTFCESEPGNILFSKNLNPAFT